ncbi:major capsid protein [uncultured Caudovirales phage]|uniref:Major capsid protein n=1 Tax=uncultured Caudovirales phage TaxID=2100421 RepID=A0A6J5RRT8_9CAUD|nr:major capsid protein [uncultured Caudovirales phage]
MATLATLALTLADWAARKDPDGKVPKIAELLTQTNAILDDAVFMEGNLETGHRIVVRTGLPIVYWRALNTGVPTSKSTTATVDETCGMLEAYSEVDVDLAMLNGNTKEFRMSEDVAFLEAMNQTMAQTMFYGNPGIDPKTYLGLAPRFSSKSAANGTNIIDAAGVSTNNASIWLVVWGENTVFCPFPKGSKAGLQHKDLGEDTVKDASGFQFQALRTHYQWKNGLAVKDWRYVVRIANINTSNLVNETSAANLIKLMLRAIFRIPNLRSGRPVFYMNRTVAQMLPVQGLNTSSNAVKVQEAISQFGQPIVNMTFMGIPIRLCDQLLITEAQVT